MTVHEFSRQCFSSVNSGDTAVGNVCYTGDRHYLVGQCFDEDCSVIGPAVIDESLFLGLATLVEQLLPFPRQIVVEE